MPLKGKIMYPYSYIYRFREIIKDLFKVLDISPVIVFIIYAELPDPDDSAGINLGPIIRIFTRSIKKRFKILVIEK